jgi:hypothetical protein
MAPPGAPATTAALVPEYLRGAAPATAQMPLRLPLALALVLEFQTPEVAPAPAAVTAVPGGGDAGRGDSPAAPDVSPLTAAALILAPDDLNLSGDSAVADLLFSLADGDPSTAAAGPPPAAEPPPGPPDDAPPSRPTRLGLWSAVSCCALKLFADHLAPPRDEMAQKKRPGL